MKKFLALPFCFFYFFTSAQTYYQATAYFTSGVTRTVTATDTFATVTASDIQAVLTQYSVPANRVYPAFPEFKESDTLLFPDAYVGRTDTIKQMNRAKIFTITVSDTVTRNNLINSLKNLTKTLFVEVNGDYASTLVPNDVHYTNQWNLSGIAPALPSIHIEQAWDVFTGNPNSVIGIVDEGIDINHPDLTTKIIGGDQNFHVTGTLSHGTAVASVAAASTNNGTTGGGIAGVDWQARILSENTHDYWACVCTNFFTKPHGWNLITKKVLAAINFSSNVWTINHSYGLVPNFLASYSVPLGEAMAYAYKNNRVSCVSSGNDNKNTTSQYPANYNTGIIQVGASNNANGKSTYSNFGANLDVVAPGDAVPALNYNNGYGTVSGTSFSSPTVAGVASLLKGFRTDLYNDDIEWLIKLSADDIAPAGRDDNTGFGKVNAARAINFLVAPSQVTHYTSYGGTTFSSSNQIIRMVACQGLSDG